MISSLSTSHGAILVDKPAGLTSAQVVSRLKRRFSFDKVGHAGTLDPDATGLLVVLVGKATRLQDLFLGASKGYSGTIRLGVVTDTDDLSGAILSSSECGILGDEEERARLLGGLKDRFIGSQLQRPPAYSALKVDGKRSYALARRGEEVVLAPRPIEILALDLEWIGADELRYRVRCSKGTYVRSLARDIGEHLGVGGTVASICREWSTPFALSEALPLGEITNETVERAWRSLEQLTEQLPRVVLDPSACAAVRQGLQWPLQTIDRCEAESAALFDTEGQFRGVLALEGGSWRVRFLM